VSQDGDLEVFGSLGRIVRRARAVGRREGGRSAASSVNDWVARPTRHLWFERVAGSIDAFVRRTCERGVAYTGLRDDGPHGRRVGSV
jgi:hypothetical protein